MHFLSPFRRGRDCLSSQLRKAEEAYIAMHNVALGDFSFSP